MSSSPPYLIGSVLIVSLNAGVASAQDLTSLIGKAPTGIQVLNGPLPAVGASRSTVEILGPAHGGLWEIASTLTGWHTLWVY